MENSSQEAPRYKNKDMNKMVEIEIDTYRERLQKLLPA